MRGDFISTLPMIVVFFILDGNPTIMLKITRKKVQFHLLKHVFLLLKSFVGTGVLFLLKAYSNGISKKKKK